MVSIAFSETNYTFAESNATVEVCVGLTGLLERNIEITMSATPLSASTDDDYIFNDSVLTFTASVSRRCVDILIVNDDIVEKSEEIILTLSSNDTSVSIISPDTVITIEDSSFIRLRFDIEEQEIQENETVTLCVILEGISNRSIMVSVVVNDTGIDY